MVNGVVYGIGNDIANGIPYGMANAKNIDLNQVVLFTMLQNHENKTGNVFALIRGPEQGLGRIFNNLIDENTTRLIVKLVQNCHFVKTKFKNRATGLSEKLDILVGYDTPWDYVTNVVESYMKTLAGFSEEGIKTFGFIQGDKIKNFDLVRIVFSFEEINLNNS